MCQHSTQQLVSPQVPLPAPSSVCPYPHQAPHHSCSVEATTPTTHHPSDSPAFDRAEDLAVAAAPKESGASSSGSSSGTVTIDGLLQLWPRQLEVDCWRSPDAVRCAPGLGCWVPLTEHTAQTGAAVGALLL